MGEKEIDKKAVVFWYGSPSCLCLLAMFVWGQARELWAWAQEERVTCHFLSNALGVSACICDVARFGFSTFLWSHAEQMANQKLNVVKVPQWCFLGASVCPCHLWILYSRGRVWVHHPSSTEGHHQFSFLWWLTQIFYCLFMYANGDQWWPPPQIALLAVAWTQAQLVNSNSTLTK